MIKTPEPGWYPNPEVPSQIRWWDGNQWTDHTAPNPMATPDVLPPSHGAGGTPMGSGLGPIGPWISETMSLLSARIGHVFTLAVVLTLVPNLVAFVIAYGVLRDAEFIMTVSGDTSFRGFDVVSVSLVAVAFFIAQLLSIAQWVGTGRQVQRERIGHPEPWSASVAPSLLRMVRVLGVQFLIQGSFLILLFVVAFLAVLIHPATLLLSIPLALAGMLYLAARTALGMAAASVAPSGLWSIPNSFNLTSQRVGPILGRLIVLVMLYFGGSTLVSFLSQVVGASEPIVFDSSGPLIINLDTFIGGNPALFLLAILLSALANSMLLSGVFAALVVLYGDLGGKFTDDLVSPVEGAESLSQSHGF